MIHLFDSLLLIQQLKRCYARNSYIFAIDKAKFYRFLRTISSIDTKTKSLLDAAF